MATGKLSRRNKLCIISLLHTKLRKCPLFYSLQHFEVINVMELSHVALRREKLEPNLLASGGQILHRQLRNGLPRNKMAYATASTRRYSNLLVDFESSIISTDASLIVPKKVKVLSISKQVQVLFRKVYSNSKMRIGELRYPIPSFHTPLFFISTKPFRLHCEDSHKIIQEMYDEWLKKVLSTPDKHSAKQKACEAGKNHVHPRVGVQCTKDETAANYGWNTSPLFKTC